jgi:LuxR family maltose regulon positive regulatory protein
LFGGLVFIHLLSGELPQALVQAQRAQLTSSKINAPNSAAWSRYWQASAHFHGNDLDMAAHHFAEAARQQYILDTRAVLDALAGLVLTQQLRQRPDEAAEAMDRLLAFAKETNDSNCLSVAQSCQARQALLKGELAEPILWAESYQETPAPAMLFCWLEVPVITRVRVLIAIGSPESLEKAIEGLDELQRLTEACQFTCQGVEIAVLQSVALEQLGRTEEAIAVLKEVVTLAGPFGWVRPFVEAGLVMADLLRQLREQNVSVDYIDTLLAAFQGSEPAVVPNVLDSGSPKELSLSSPSPRFFDASSAPQLQVEPLTNRELEILELLAQRLRNQEIADQLYISVETVKTHLNNIYQKLQVGNRREAVEKAKKMGIF